VLCPAVLAGPHFSLSSWPLLHYFECTGSSLFPLYWSRHAPRPFCPPPSN